MRRSACERVSSKLACPSAHEEARQTGLSKSFCARSENRSLQEGAAAWTSRRSTDFACGELHLACKFNKEDRLRAGQICDRPPHRGVTVGGGTQDRPPI